MRLSVLERQTYDKQMRYLSASDSKPDYKSTVIEIASQDREDKHSRIFGSSFIGTFAFSFLWNFIFILNCRYQYSRDKETAMFAIISFTIHNPIFPPVFILFSRFFLDTLVLMILLYWR